VSPCSWLIWAGVKTYIYHPHPFQWTKFYCHAFKPSERN